MNSLGDSQEFSHGRAGEGENGGNIPLLLNLRKVNNEENVFLISIQITRLRSLSLEEDRSAITSFVIENQGSDKYLFYFLKRAGNNGK